MIKKLFIGIWFLTACLINPAMAQTLDRIVAVVEDDVILERELNAEAANITQKLRGNNVAIPPESVLRTRILGDTLCSKFSICDVTNSVPVIRNKPLPSLPVPLTNW